MARKPITVSQLNKYIGQVLRTDPILGNVSVLGEISNLKYHSSGHVYFTLKDSGSRINCFMPYTAAQHLRYELTDGMQVTASGYLSVYEKGGYYSFNIKDIELSGEGSLSVAYKALYDKLKKEGLFDAKKKKPLPAFPKKICVITSPTGAAVRDILKIIRMRNDVVSVLVYPCLVQGENAAPDIAAAISQVNRDFPDTDIIIVGRGGGSLEELWAFNEEIVARSIYDSEIPVISAVGHETDFSISDYVADRRAETPTAAAVMAAPDTTLLRDEIDGYLKLSADGVRKQLRYREASIERYNPAMLVKILSYRHMKEESRVNAARDHIKNHMNLLIERKENAVKGLAAKSEAQVKLHLENISGRLKNLKVMLEAGNPERILKRGYAAVTDPATGRILSKAQDFEGVEDFELKFIDGRVKGHVTEKYYD